MELNSLIVDTVQRLLAELTDGPTDVAYVLNRGDCGLLASLRSLSAAQASARPAGRSSIASHVHHLRYSLSLINRWVRGEDMYGQADWTESWRHQQVTDAEWHALVDALDSEIRTWLTAIPTLRQLDAAALREAIGSVVHLAYHLGAIRQLDAAAAGPREARS
jgi:hypothetical protein